MNIYGVAIVRFARDGTPGEAEVRQLTIAHGFHVLNLSYALDDQGQAIEYRMAIRSIRPANFAGLAESLRTHPGVRGFAVLPSAAD